MALTDTLRIIWIIIAIILEVVISSIFGLVIQFTILPIPIVGFIVGAFPMAIIVGFVLLIISLILHYVFNFIDTSVEGKNKTYTTFTNPDKT
jgi:uncharacterized membrane protein